MIRILNLAILTLAISVPVIARGDSSPRDDSGASYISDFFRATVDAAVSADSEEHAVAGVTPLVDRHVSLDETARFVLGRYWPEDDPKATHEFQAAFRSFAIEAFTRGLRAHPSLALAVSRGKPHGDGTLLVPSRLRLPTGVTVPLDWYLEKARPDGPFQIVDVSVAGIDARLMLRNVAMATLANGAGNLETLIGLFRRSIAPAVAMQSDAAAADIPAPRATDP